MLALTAAIAVGVWHYQAGREQDTRQEWAQRASRELGDQVGQTGAALVGVRGLFAASNRVEKDEFARFAAIQLDRSSLLGLTWMPRVTRDGRRRFELATGRSIVDRAPDGSFRPAGNRAEYFPLRYVAPETPESVRSLGIDGTRSTAAGRPSSRSPETAGARRSARRSRWERLRADRGTVLVVAVYRTGAPLDTVADREPRSGGSRPGPGVTISWARRSWRSCRRARTW